VKPPIEDVIKALVEAGLPADEIASTIAKMFGSGGDEVAKVADEAIPAKPPKTPRVKPELVPEGKPLPAAEKLAAASTTPKFVRPKFDDVVHAKTTEKFSDIMSADEFAAAADKDLKYIRNSKLNAAENEERRLAGRAKSDAKSQANKAAHASTRTPEARRAAAAKQQEYFKNLKKGDK
jgi:hypothetical protein